MQHTYKLDSGYNPTDKIAALGKAFEVSEEKYPLGVLYQTNRNAYHQEAVADSSISLIKQPRFQDFDGLVEEFI